jgi:inorganic pyrophosphatase
MTDAKMIQKFLQFHFQAHPWHGIPASPEPGYFNCYIELTPVDGVKYEVDKSTGHIKVDRPQKYSNLCPTLYGFIPRTYCGTDVGNYCCEKVKRKGIVGDGDPLDVCVLTEKPISHTGILVHAIPIGGLRMIDHNQADDKIIAVLKNDITYGHWRSMNDVPQGLLDRLRQYFLTYKQGPDTQTPVEISHVYDRAEALEVIKASQADYLTDYGPTHNELAAFLNNLAETVSQSQTS